MKNPISYLVSNSQEATARQSSNNHTQSAPNGAEPARSDITISATVFRDITPSDANIRLFEKPKLIRHFKHVYGYHGISTQTHPEDSSLSISESYDRVLACYHQGLLRYSYALNISYIKREILSDFIPQSRRTDYLRLLLGEITPNNSHMSDSQKRELLTNILDDLGMPIEPNNHNQFDFPYYFLGQKTRINPFVEDRMPEQQKIHRILAIYHQSGFFAEEARTILEHRGVPIQSETVIYENDRLQLPDNLSNQAPFRSMQMP